MGTRRSKASGKVRWLSGHGGGGEGGGDKSRPPVLGCPAERTPELMALSLSAL